MDIMKSEAEVDALMSQIPECWRENWCGGERGLCACMGCVQIGNRTIMARENGTPHSGDPEYINEQEINPEVRQRLKITREEWEAWMKRHRSKD